MTAHTPPVVPLDMRPALLRRMLQLLLTAVLFAVVLAVAAGTARWWNLWAFTCLFLALVLANAVFVLPRNPEAIAARERRHPGTRTFDNVLMGTYTVVYLGMFVLAGLDAKRFGWAPLAWPWALAGALMLVASTVPIAGALAANPYLETTVRIQSDRGHRVVTAGPYRYVRHPMYVGQILQLPASVLLLGSTWALLPAFACAVIMVIRTALEDRMLRRDLAGYAAYATTTRYRLLPGVW